MATNDIATKDGTPVRFLLDRSFLHDSFRTDYPPNKSAKWLFPYLVHRVSQTRMKVCAISSAAIDRWSGEFRTYPGLSPRVVLAVEAIADVYPTGGGSSNLDDSTLIMAKLLDDKGIVPIILSSVKADKWSERTQRLGIKLGLEEFTEEMSERRVVEQMWCAPLTADSCVRVMTALDPLFNELVKLVGYPEK